MMSPVPVARAHESFLECAAQAEVEGGPKCGVKGPSVLFLLTFFHFHLASLLTTCMLCVLALSDTQHASGLTTRPLFHTVWAPVSTKLIAVCVTFSHMGNLQVAEATQAAKILEGL